MRKCWDCHWKERVAANAQMSTCRTRHVGGVLVRDNRVVADGFNGNLSGHPHCDSGPDGCPRCNDPSVKSGEQLERCWCVHAEQNILSYCARYGIPTEGTTIYLPATSCVDCWKLCISAGIKEHVLDEEYPGAHATVLQMASRSNILARRYECHCDNL